MKRQRLLLASLLCAILCPYLAQAGGPFRAYSMQVAERQMRLQGNTEPPLMQLGGITSLAGMVYDAPSQGLIIVGQANPGQAAITLDDFVVALRAVIVHNQWPRVSIDRTPDTKSTGKQTVLFEGKLENTHFGKDLLEADITLKKLALGLLPAEIWGVRSYFSAYIDNAKQRQSEDIVGSRFWFYIVGDPTFAERTGVFAIRDVQIGVKTEVMYAAFKGKNVKDIKRFHDKSGDEFSGYMNREYLSLSTIYPEIGRVKTLLDLVSLAKGVQRFPSELNLNYWLQNYEVQYVETLKDYDLLVRKETVQGKDNRVKEVEINGGIELRAKILRLKAGDTTALKEAVLQSRPHPHALTWEVPLAGWEIPGALPAPSAPEARSDQTVSLPQLEQKDGGFSLEGQIRARGGPAIDYGKSLTNPLPALSVDIPKFTRYENLLPQRHSTHVGGVMLLGTAKVAGKEQAQVDLSQGNFSLIVDGERANLAPETFSKFVTALWAVYYSKQAPGISIDPIAPGIDKHLVRYIGKVINTDLGRVMRDADYTMKQWAVGTARPYIPGFKDVDDLMAKHGFRYLGASRRFWFVPENMRFKRGNDLLLFDDGRMAVKTEYVLQNKGVKAEPADEAFAAFFTERYQVIAEKYPVYKELFEYAKLVALAKYLKEQGVPLFWFLMANKDLVLTEDSPGTVDALAKGSKHFEGMGIAGGVNLWEQGKYVYDPQAVQAIEKAVAQRPATMPGNTKLSLDKTAAGARAQPFSFELGKRQYSVVPQHTLTSGKDRRGIRYQTDLALRHQGEPGLELVRYYNPRQPEGGAFGNGWHLLVPYRVKPVGTVTRPFLNVIIPEQMAVENLLTGAQEVLTFSTERYTIAGYVPDQLETSQVIGLFLLSDASYRLADKLGNEFWFDQAGSLTDMLFAAEHRVHIDYLHTFTQAFEPKPYRLQAAEGEWIAFQNVRLPKRMTVTDRLYGRHEELIFSTARAIAGYAPETPSTSRFQFMALRTDGSFQLLDKAGNEIAFTQAGEFAALAVASDRPLVAALSQGNHRVKFTYTLDPGGYVRVASAALFDGERATAPTTVVRYDYDNAGRLARVQGPVKQVAALPQRPPTR